MPSYYTPSGKPLNQTRGLAAEVRAEFQLIQAGFSLLPIPAAVVGGYANYSADTGTANAYVLTLGSAVTGYVDGLTVMFKAGAANTGAATVNINALGLKTITRSDGSVLQAGDILAGQIVQVSYSTTNGKFQLLASGAAVSALSAAASALSASNSASAASGSAIAASGSASNASTSASNAALSATVAANYAAALSGTSASAVLIGTGAKNFTASTGKQWAAGQFLTIASAANNANFMHGQVTSYDAGTGELAINVLDFDGAGTFAGWLITVAGTQGPRGLASVSSVAPKQLITAPVTQAVAGGAYALSNAAVLGADTNFVVRSGKLDDASWTRVQCTVTASATPAPYGIGTMYTLSGVAGQVSYLQSSPAATVSGAEYWFRLHLKAGSSALSKVSIYNGALSTLVAGVTINWALGMPTVTGLSGITGFMLTFLGNGVYEIRGIFTSGAGAAVLPYPDMNSVGATTEFWGVEISYTALAYIPTDATPVTRPAGVIAPQRIVLPASPNSNDAISVMSANGSAENIIDPNGQQFYGPSGPLAGPLKLDSKNAAVDLQFINGYWRLV